MYGVLLICMSVGFVLICCWVCLLGFWLYEVVCGEQVLTMDTPCWCNVEVFRVSKGESVCTCFECL